MEGDALGIINILYGIIVVGILCRKLARIDVKGVNIAKEVARSNQLNTRLNCRYSHIGKGVVVAVDKNAYRIGHSVSDYIHVVYVGIRRAAVGAALDVKSYLRALDG